MRRLFAAPLLVMFAACGGSSPTTSPTGGTPAAIAVVAGEGQRAEPGANVTVKPVVAVKDAAGHGVAGVRVSFTVDSGGGSLQAASATTAADGTASPGDWRLGASEGRNVLRATAGSLAPLLLHADGRFGLTRTLISAQNVAVAGGTLRYTRSGDALSGFEINVPANAYSGSTIWNVSADSTVQVPLPTGFSQVGPVLVIGNGQGYATSLIAVTVPMRVSADNAVEPFFFDAASGTLEGVPLLARSDSSITFASRHFSGSLMAIPGSAPGPSGIRGAAGVFKTFRAFGAPSEFGTIKMVFIKIPQSELIGTFSSTFHPGKDDWEFPNNGDYQGPNGICEGMTVTALYYHYNFRVEMAPQLFGRFDHFPTNAWDNVRGIHLAGAVQADYVSLIPTMKSEKDAIRNAAAKNGESVESLASTWILFNLKINRLPLGIAVFRVGGGHALVAYTATATAGSVVIGIANPNLPGAAQTLTFQGGNMVPMQYSEIANGPSNNYTNATAFGVTSDIPLTNLNSRWAEFIAGTPGEDRLPARFFEVYDSVNATWSALPETVQLIADTLKLRVRCPACPINYDYEGGIALLMDLLIFNPEGTGQLAMGPVAKIPLAVGTRQLFAQANAWSVASGSAENGESFLDGRLFTVIKGKLRLMPASLSGKPDTAYTFTLTHGGIARPDSRLVWNFGDGTPPATVVGDSIRTHAYTAVGNYTVTVELRDASNKLLGRSTSVVTITAGVQAWKFTSASVAFGLSQPPVVELGSYDGRWGADSAILGRIANGVTQGGIRLVDQAFSPPGLPSRTAPVGLYLLEGQSLTLANLLDQATADAFIVTSFASASTSIPAAPQVNGWNLLQQAGPVNPLCHVNEDSYLFSGTVTAGHLVGLRVPLCVQRSDVPWVDGQRLMALDADVTFTGTTASGTINMTWYFYGNFNPGTYLQRTARLTFTATRVVN